MNSITSIKSYLKRSSNVPSIPPIPLVVTASGLTMTSGSANFVNSANWTYYVVTTGTGTISFNRAPLANIQVFAAGGGGQGGNNNISASTTNNGRGAGAGSGACYWNSGILLNSGTINVSIGTGGISNNIAFPYGANGGTTTISGNVFPSITLRGGEGGQRGNINSTVAFGGFGGTHINGTYNGSDNNGGRTGGSNIGKKGIGSGQLGISIGDTVMTNYCNSGSGGSRATQNPKNVTYVNGIIGDGGNGADSNATTNILGQNGTNGGFILAIPSTA